MALTPATGSQLQSSRRPDSSPVLACVGCRLFSTLSSRPKWRDLPSRPP